MTKRENRIVVAGGIAPWEDLIGERYANRVCGLLLADFEVWIFGGTGEIEACTDLTAQEKKDAKKSFHSQGNGFIIWFRQKFDGCALKPRVFTSPDGHREVQFKWSGGHAAHYLPEQSQGWLERPDGSRVRVLYDRTCGWIASSGS